jgi:hypothetical protein
VAYVLVLSPLPVGVHVHHPRLHCVAVGAEVSGQVPKRDPPLLKFSPVQPQGHHQLPSSRSNSPPVSREVSRKVIRYPVTEFSIVSPWHATGGTPLFMALVSVLTVVDARLPAVAVTVTAPHLKNSDG